MWTRKKKIIAAVILAGAICFIDVLFLIIGACFDSRIDDIGVELSVSNVSRKAMSFTLKRDKNPEKDGQVSTNHVCILEKKTILGWRTYGEAGSGATDILKRGFSETWDIKLEHLYDGEITPGIYRFGINIWIRKNGERQKETLYKTFLVSF